MSSKDTLKEIIKLARQGKFDGDAGMKVKVNDIIEPCELDVYLIWSERIVGGSPVEKKLTDDGGMYSRIAVPDCDTECEFKWSAPRELLAGW